MRQASRIAIIGLLALMQLFAPLVHAHTGGGQLAGTVHVPGLEFLAKSNGHSALAPASQGECLDVIVVPAPGLKNPGDHAIPTPDPELLLAVLSSLVAGSPAGHPSVSLPRSFLLLDAAKLKPSPRAPPRPV